MILTLTGNLLAERTLQFTSWTSGKTQRATSESFQVGGKGVNVTKMLSRIGAATTAWCFVGGASGHECAAWLLSRGIPHRAFPTSAPTRTGTVVRAEGQPETTFLGPDRPVDALALQTCAEALNSARRPHTVLALCGSFPGWSSDEAAPLREASEAWAKAGSLVVDSYGPPLHWAIERPTALIKINRHEFDTLFDASEQSAPVLQRLAVAKKRWPVQRWIITDGPQSVCHVSVDTEPAAQVPPAVVEVSATGSGDVLFACVLHALFNRKLGLAEAVAFALPYAAANAAHPGVADFDLNLLTPKGSVHP
jgi:fructose-1-phosphate kinase PfkB-like protein